MEFLNLNPPPIAYPDDLQTFVSAETVDAAVREIMEWDAYGPTPLLTLPKLAADLDVAAALYKDESRRLGLTSFKAIGGAYAVAKVLAERLPQAASSGDVLSGRYASSLANETMACATAGNHGLAVAWAAKACGCKCVVYMHAGVPAARVAAIEAAGAEVVRTAGDYDQSVAQLDADARLNGWQVIADTAYPGYEEIPSLIMQGYCTLTHEIFEASDTTFTHVFLQAGVGTFASAIAAHFWIRFGSKRPKIILVEPKDADCFYQSLKNGTASEASGGLNTIMTGLSTRGVSTSAWQILKRCTDAIVTINDEECLQTLKMLRGGAWGEDDIDAGPSGIAGLVAARKLAADPATREALGIDSGSRFLVFGTEGPNGIH